LNFVIEHDDIRGDSRSRYILNSDTSLANPERKVRYKKYII